MGVFDFLFTDNEKENKPVINPNKPLSGQLNDNTTKPYTVLPNLAGNGNVVGSMSIGATVQQSTPAIQLTEEDVKKFEKHFTELFNGLNDPKPSYHEFIASVDAMGNVIADNVKYSSIFAGFKMQGLTREILLNTANDTLNAIVQDATSYNEQCKLAIEQEIGGKKTLLQQKADEIKKLQDGIAKLQAEIVQLNGEIETGQQKIVRNNSIFNSMSTQLQEKIKHDISNITAYIQ